MTTTTFESLESRRMFSASAIGTGAQSVSENEAAISVSHQIDKTPVKDAEMEHEGNPET